MKKTWMDVFHLFCLYQGFSTSGSRPHLGSPSDVRGVARLSTNLLKNDGIFKYIVELCGCIKTLGSRSDYSPTFWVARQKRLRNTGLYHLRGRNLSGLFTSPPPPVPQVDVNNLTTVNRIREVAVRCRSVMYDRLATITRCVVPLKDGHWLEVRQGQGRSLGGASTPVTSGAL